MTRSVAATIGILLTLHVHAEAVAQSPLVQARIERIEQGLLTPVMLRGTPGLALADRMRMYGVPAVSVAVINDGRIEWARAWGLADPAAGTVADTATLFQAASISKPVAAIAALRLVEAGRLGLDEDVNTRLTSWRVPDNAFTRAAPVTLRRLLSHSAGLTVHGFRGYAAGEDVPTVVQVLKGERPANSAAVRADTTPGALWRYSGGGSTVVQLLMQDVTGQPFADLVRDQVLRRAGMPHSTYEQPLPADRAATAAIGHRASGTAVTGRWHTYPEQFAAGLWTTPSDLARLALEVQHSARGGGDGLLSTATTRHMLTRQAGDYGLGFGLAAGDGWTTFSHGGANEGFRAILVAFADRGQGAVIMTNSDAGAQLYSEILRAIAAEYDWPTQRARVRDVVAAEPAMLATFAGSYGAEVNGRRLSLTVRFDGTALHVNGAPLAPAGERALHHAGGGRFFMLQGTAELAFVRDVDGRVTGAVIDGGGAPIQLVRER